MIKHLSLNLFSPKPSKHAGFNAIDLQEWELNAVWKSLHRHTTTKQIAKFSKIDEQRTRQILYDIFNLKLVKPLRNDCWGLVNRKAKGGKNAKPA